MKVNQPVTTKEVNYSAERMLVSKTDLKGMITYVNQDFVEISGFVEKELIGASHNIVRHPDMPPEAFEDLWKTLKAGLPWTGLVKNRTKLGDYYWVVANVTPIRQGGQLVGYMSVRSKPTREQIATAEHAYQMFRTNRAKGLAICEGSVVSSSAYKIRQLLDWSFTSRIWITLTILAASTLIGGIMGLHNLANADASIRQLYEQNTSSLRSIHELGSKTSNLRAQLQIALTQPSTENFESASKRISEVREQQLQVGTMLGKNIAQAPAVAQLKALGEKYAQFERLGLAPTQIALNKGDVATLKRLYKDVLDAQLSSMQNGIDTLAKAVDDGAKDVYLESTQAFQRVQIETYAGVGAAIAIAIALGFLLIRSVLQPLLAAAKTFNAIADGNYRSHIPTGRKDEIGRLLYGLKAMQIKLGFDFKDAQRVANENLRIREALDCVTTNVMIADNNGDIIYMNKSIYGMFNAAQADLQKDLPHFRTDGILGSNFDVFHRNPAHQRGLIQALKSTFTTKIGVGGRTFQLTANPVINQGGDRLGTSVEWIDATQEVKVEEQIKEVVGAAAAGDFTTRLSLDDKSGFLKELSANINQLLQTSDTGLREVLRVLSAISGGDLSQNITNDYHGTFGELKDYCNNTVAVLSNIVNQLDHAVNEANKGNFKVSIDTTGMHGFQSKIGVGVNSLMETSDTGLGEVLRVLAALAKGDLTEKITNDYQGTFGMLKDYSNTTVDSLKKLVNQISSAVESINVAAGEISAGNHDLSQRTEEQAASLEETSASMEELTSTVKNNADEAVNAGNLVMRTSQIAEKGGDVVRQSVLTMEKISESSRRISDIIGVIDGIAFQTNILALNAAVEAARAGEQGRGFAVVAGEVRNLAQRSATAAKEIKDLITDSVSKVESGTAQVNVAGTTMTEIVQSIAEVSTIMEGISSASREQSIGIEHVNIAITQMDDVTQQNAALVEQASAAAQSLHEQAVELSRAMAVFRVK